MWSTPHVGVNTRKAIGSSNEAGFMTGQGVAGNPTPAPSIGPSSRFLSCFSSGAVSTAVRLGS